MNTPVKTLTALAIASALVSPGAASAHDEQARLSKASQIHITQARRATARFHDFDAALAAGYGPAPVIDVNGLSCIDQPGKGAMGVHYANGGLFTANLDPSMPQALIYEPRADGSQRLVGLEYIVLQSVWEGQFPGTTPKLYGEHFHLVPAGNRYGLPDFYALHLWLWQPNPDGLFADWNPSVSCP